MFDKAYLPKCSAPFNVCNTDTQGEVGHATANFPQQPMERTPLVHVSEDVCEACPTSPLGFVSFCTVIQGEPDPVEQTFRSSLWNEPL